ncbi:MAG: sigma-54 dependent transcriptional regulator [Deltaproteobacteria bacterium]|nr:sigma-54 dependent transcriptional regulator [Deltaproteobacteria bacterium]
MVRGASLRLGLPLTDRELLLFRGGALADGLRETLEAMGWRVRSADEAPEARGLVEAHSIRVGLVSLDRRAESIEAFRALLAEELPVHWVALLPRPDLEDEAVVELVGCHCCDYHTQPIDPGRLLLTLGHASGMAELQRRVTTAQQQELSGEGMLGSSDAIQAVFRSLRKIATVDAPVLIVGESGTGKELAAQAIHRRSARASGPFVAVNCGALPPTLIQSELFGHERGAFTGAHRRVRGRLEAAHGGTIFLDEIGELPLELQVNLLRFLETHNVQRVGGTEEVHVDARVIAATHVDLARAVEEGHFREDLYYRLEVLLLRMPALRERGTDVALLARDFALRFGESYGCTSKRLAPEALRALELHDWPGNVRELMNRVRRALVMSEGELLSCEDLGLPRPTSAEHPPSLTEVRREAEREAVRSALAATDQNHTRAARRLGVSRMTLYRLLARLELE